MDQLYYTHLENIPVANDLNHIDFRFAVQTVLRPHTDEYHDYRGYAGRISSGILRIGDQVTALPSQLQSRVKKIHCADQRFTRSLCASIY